MQPLTGPYIYGVNRRSENFLLLSVIYTGLIKTEIDNWNLDGYFHRACALCEKSWRKVQENLVEHQIIKNDKKLNSIICLYFAPHSQENAFSLLHGTIPTYYSQTWCYKFLNS